ncbi:Fic family protein [Pseudomonas syringae]|uniref:Fic family protein n=2 Tax=Pseudomonas syringae TaxID=317 RepID=UPI0009ADD999|nr:Fic family protein [Pseudomonas syringae]
MFDKSQRIFMPTPILPTLELEEIQKTELIRFANSLIDNQHAVESSLPVNTAIHFMKSYTDYRFDHRLSVHHQKIAKHWEYVSRIEDERLVYSSIYQDYKDLDLFYSVNGFFEVIKNISTRVLGTKAALRKTDVRTGKDRHGVCLVYPPAESLQGGLNNLIEFCRSQKKDITSVAVMATFLLGLHPFLDGNGRVVRILTNLLLGRSPETYIPFSELNNISNGGYGIRCRIAVFSNKWSEIIEYYAHLYIAVELGRISSRAEALNVCQEGISQVETGVMTSSITMTQQP